MNNLLHQVHIQPDETTFFEYVNWLKYIVVLPFLSFNALLCGSLFVLSHRGSARTCSASVRLLALNSDIWSGLMWLDIWTCLGPCYPFIEDSINLIHFLSIEWSICELESQILCMLQYAFWSFELYPRMFFFFFEIWICWP